MAAVILASAATPALAEEIKIEDAHIGVAGIGETYALAEGHFFWVGEFTGIMTNPSNEALDNIAIQCPGWLEFNAASNLQRGGGYCTNTLQSGDTYLTRWACEGTADPDSCLGTFEVVGATGAMTGLTGSGTFEAAPSVPHANGVVSNSASATWDLVTP
jgi:hypothetical protein